jgi:hypothetical protein
MSGAQAPVLGEQEAMKDRADNPDLRILLQRAGANAIWITPNVVQAAAPGGRVMTLVRAPFESGAELAARALAEFKANDSAAA